MNQSKTMLTKMLFVVGLGLVTMGSINAMEREVEKIDNQKQTIAKPKVQQPKKTKKIQPASDQRNKMLLNRELYKQKKELVATEYKANEYQLQKDKQKNKDRAKQERVDAKNHETAKQFARNSTQK